MSAPVLAFADYTKEFLLETDASREGLGAVLSKNRKMGDTIWSPMVAEPSPVTKRTIILPNMSSKHENGLSQNISKSTCSIDPS